MSRSLTGDEEVIRDLTASVCFLGLCEEFLLLLFKELGGFEQGSDTVPPYLSGVVLPAVF